MAVSRIQKSSILQGFPKSRSLLAGNSYYVPPSFESIATSTVGAGGVSSVSFTSIPSTYTHLQIRIIARTNRSAIGDYVAGTFNSDTGANYSYHNLLGTGTAVAVGAGASSSFLDFERIAGNTAGSNVFGTVIVDILDYANTNKYKTTKSLGGFDSNGSGEIQLDSSSWRNTNAITSITFVPGVGTSFLQYSSFALYGIKGA